MIDVIFLAGGLLLIIQGAEFLITGASSIAKRFGLSDLVIGLTIVAFGTSLPEMIVSILAGLGDNSELTIGNVIGSNIANILLILGATAMFTTLRVELSTVRREIPFSFLGVVVLGVLMSERLVEGAPVATISRLDGIILLTFFSIFIYYTFLSAYLGGSSDKTDDYEKKPLFQSWGYVGIGIAGLLFGGQISVDSAIELATVLGISETIVGLTVVAIGTSLPELTTSIIAARKDQADLAIGNVVGSNIFNIFWILGVSSIIKPIPVTNEIGFDFAILVLASMVLFLSLLTFKQQAIIKKEGILFLAIYAGYLLINVIRVL